MNLKVIAEVSETRSQLEHLKKPGGPLGQGDFLSNPIIEAEFSALLTPTQRYWKDTST